MSLSLSLSLYLFLSSLPPDEDEYSAKLFGGILPRDGGKFRGKRERNRDRANSARRRRV